MCVLLLTVLVHLFDPCRRPPPTALRAARRPGSLCVTGCLLDPSSLLCAPSCRRPPPSCACCRGSWRRSWRRARRTRRGAAKPRRGEPQTRGGGWEARPGVAVDGVVGITICMHAAMQCWQWQLSYRLSALSLTITKPFALWSTAVVLSTLCPFISLPRPDPPHFSCSVT